MDNLPRATWIELDETDSTNNYLRHYKPQAVVGGVTFVTVEYQTAGRGQTGNHWESERGQNLLFSLLYSPQGVEARECFILSQAIAMGVLDGVCSVFGAEASRMSLKWPNDLYWRDSKMGGILIETELQGHRVENMIAGVGVNVNQQSFTDYAPNPVSMFQITGKATERGKLMSLIAENILFRLRQAETGRDSLRRDYTEKLYRSKGIHQYEDENGTFFACMTGIEPDGHLLLTDTQGTQRRYAFKEVRFIL